MANKHLSDTEYHGADDATPMVSFKTLVVWILCLAVVIGGFILAHRHGWI